MRVLTGKQLAAKTFFSAVRTEAECRNFARAWVGNAIEIDTLDRVALEQLICDIFVNEMIDFNLRFARSSVPEREDERCAS